MRILRVIFIRLNNTFVGTAFLIAQKMIKDLPKYLLYPLYIIGLPVIGFLVGAVMESAMPGSHGGFRMLGMIIVLIAGQIYFSFLFLDYKEWYINILGGLGIGAVATFIAYFIYGTLFNI